MTTYGQDGVNVSEGDSFSAMAGEICRGTFNNSPFVEVHAASGHFRGPRAFRIVNLPKSWTMDATSDGMGTKVVVVDAARAYRQAARDLVAMTADDLVRWGGKPLILVNLLDLRSIGREGDATNQAARQLMVGLGEVAQDQEIVCFRGETAELGQCVGSEDPDAMLAFNWGGFMIGAYLPDRMITGETLSPGQAVVALREKGFRSNGLSSVRAALRKRFGQEWWALDEAQAAIKAAGRPAKIYSRLLSTANGWTHPIQRPHFKFHLIAHITGGGVVGKFAEDILFPRGLSARLDSLFDPPVIMRQVAEWREIPEEEHYRTFNGGNGALVVLDEAEVEGFLVLARLHGVEAQRCGSITRNDSAPTLTIKSGYESGQWIEYKP